MNGGPSHVDTFDPKPLLDKYPGKPLPNPNLRTERKTAGAMRSPFTFKKYGHSGIEVSELFAQTAEHVDDICVIRSMHADVPNHEPSLMLMNCGDGRAAAAQHGLLDHLRPGHREPEPARLHRHVSRRLSDRGDRRTGVRRSCPAPIQGTYIDTQHTDVEKLIENIRNRRSHSGGAAPAARPAAAAESSATWSSGRATPSWKPASSRSSWPTACRRRPPTPSTSSREPAVRELYGPGMQARQLLIARRLLERGVRFVQVWHGAGPAVGQSRQPRARRIAAWPGAATSRSPRS